MNRMKVNFEVEQRQAVGGNYSLLKFLSSVFSSLYMRADQLLCAADFIWELLILVLETIQQPMVLQKLVMLQLCMKACTLHKAASYSTKCMKASGQFRVKKTSFERTVSKLIFLGQNMLVRPHGVHQGQF